MVSPKLRLGAALALVVVSIAAVPAWTGSRDPLPANYRQWVDRDAAYLITKEEREAFMRLASNETRDAFIQRFWELRNPTPDAPSNPFKEECYRPAHCLCEPVFQHGSRRGRPAQRPRPCLHHPGRAAATGEVPAHPGAGPFAWPVYNDPMPFRSSMLPWQKKSKTPPPDETGQEAGYLKTLGEKQTPVTIKLMDGEVVNGWVEYYDQKMIRLTREGAPNLFIFKHEIMYIAEDSRKRRE